MLWHLYVFIPVLFSTNDPIGELKIYDRKNVLITHLPKSGGLQIPILGSEPLPENLVKAFTTIEDERFYSHWGVDAFAKLRAFRDNLKAQKIVSGGSTITEQWVKNAFFSHSKRTLPQKLREATVAIYSSLVFSKEEILRKYLDTIYFGHRNYGIKAAMKSYFDKSHLETLTDEELITLLAIIRSPGVINLNEQYFQERWKRIREGLKGVNGDKGPKEEEELPLKTLKPFTPLNRFPHVTSTIRQLVDDDSPGTTIALSTVDSTLQAEAEKLINQSLTRLSGKNVTNGAAYVVQPSTGEILVWVGSKNFYDKTIDGQVNIITQQRQMGSALKPFIYLYAFTKGAHPDQLIVDLEKDFESEKQDEAYRPLNYGLREGGVMPLKSALANSFNISAVRLLEHLGLENTYRFMKDLGLNFDQPAHHYGLSLALGSPDLRMQDVADAYAGLANGGKKIASHLIRNEGPQSSQPPTLSRAEPRDPNYELPYFYLFDTLSNPLNRRRSFGTNSILNTSIPFAVKTGTTKNFHDNWTFGYHPDLVVATWVGNNDNSPMIDVDGITGAGPIWHRLTEFTIQQGYVRPSIVHGPSSLSQAEKCLDERCSRKELVYQEADQQWFSDLESGHYCLEDFFIQDIEPAEITKIAKVFEFKDFTIEWCNSPGGAGTAPRRDAINRVSTADGDIVAAGELHILKPSPNETFYIRQDIPLDLQQIILKANQEVEWFVDEIWVGYGKNIFIQPKLGKHTIVAKQDKKEDSVSIEVLPF
ncbi:MAG: transglycosylase domain-containing protein [Candidatus Altimarinota bacterium]